MDVIGFLLTLLVIVLMVVAVDYIAKHMMISTETRRLIMAVIGILAIIFIVAALLGRAPYFRLT